MIGGFNPAEDGDIEFLQTVEVLFFVAQGGFEVALDVADEAFDLAFAPSVVGLGVEQADAEIGADDAGVVADKGLALVGVEFVGQAAAQYCLLEAVEEGDGVAS